VNIKSQLRYLRITPFDTSLPEGRAQERHRRMVMAALASVFAKMTNLFVLIITAPMTLHYLGKERYGIWMVMSSTVAMMSVADLGLGNGLLNFVAKAKGQDDRDGMHRAVSSAFYMLLSLACIIGLLIYIIWPYINVGSIFNIDTLAVRKEASPAFAILIGCFLMGLPLTVSNQIQQGHQDGWKTSLWSIVGSLLSLGLVIVAIYNKASLSVLMLSIAGAPILAQLSNTFYLFGYDKKWLKPEIRLAQKKDAKALLKLGLLFAILQLSWLMANQIDNLVLTRILGPGSVPSYVLTQRLFMLMPVVMSLLLVPMRPAYGEAVARGDQDWVLRTFKRSIRLAFILNTSAALFLFFFVKTIIRIWVGEDLIPSTVLVFGFSLWLIMQSFDAPIAVFTNGIGKMKATAILVPLASIANVCLSIIFTRHIGVAGPVFGTLLAQLVVFYLPFLIIFPKLLKGFSEC